MSVEQLTRDVRKFQDSTGEQALLVLFQDEDEQPAGMHMMGWTPQLGLTIDGWPVEEPFYSNFCGYQPLQHPPSVLH